MFGKIKSLEDGFRVVWWIAIVSITALTMVSGWAIWRGMSSVNDAFARIYVLANGQVMRATAVDSVVNLPVEARDHLRNFHHFFFDLGPDEKAIKASVDRSLYLADGSAKTLYDNLLESGFISGLISGNITQSVVLDSIWLDMDHAPFAFRCSGVQTLIRSTSLTTRSIVTRGRLRRCERSDNNPHGWIIEGFEVEQNKDVKTVSR